ncbi:13196_t:CDS:2 [Ambispora gerdemannii]|uniref:13196_t:CDS:1 n=1 Tax=Ambispora gerdemannii TaxID=144530 RepID=A0A9N8WPM3_9GLOM|nr:13196_t:CDS:2 [Ambispora gerdemannii]
MSATGQKAHRRTLSLIQGNSNGSSENLAISKQNPSITRSQQQQQQLQNHHQYLSSIDTKSKSSNNLNHQKNINSVSNNIKNNTNSSSIKSSSNLIKNSSTTTKIGFSTPPSTPSKQKTFTGKSKNSTTDNFKVVQVAALYNVKDVLFTLVFFGALIIFLGSLMGIGPFDEDEHFHNNVIVSSSKKQQVQQQEHFQQPSPSQPPPIINDRIAHEKSDQEGQLKESNTILSNNDNDLPAGQSNNIDTTNIDKDNNNEEKSTGSETDKQNEEESEDEFVVGFE